MNIKLLLVVSCLLWYSPVSAEEDVQIFKWDLNLMPSSMHHGESDTINEQHNGVGASFTLPNRAKYGLMYFTDSYGHSGILMSLRGELDDCEICLGGGVSYSHSYSISSHTPTNAFVTVRYKWATIIHVPAEVTSLVITFPLNY